MKLYKIWTSCTKNNILGLLPPTIDPFDQSLFYVSDGIGTPYPAIKFRKLSIETGEELAPFLITYSKNDKNELGGWNITL